MFGQTRFQVILLELNIYLVNHILTLMNIKLVLIASHLHRILLHGPQLLLLSVMRLSA